MPGVELLHTPLLLLVAALAFSAAAARHRQHRGLGAWQLALWMACAGAAVQAFAGPAQAAPWAWLAPLLLMQWPVWFLLGLRQFNGRNRLPATRRFDIAMLWLASAAQGAPALWPEQTMALALACTASVGLHLYAAVLLFHAPAGRAGTPVLAVAAAAALAGLLPVLAMLPEIHSPVWHSAQALAAGLGGVLMAFVALTLLYDRTEQMLRASRRRLRQLANLDPLTQLPNRRHFQDLASRALRQDAPGSAALLIFDIDHFKHVNDHLGHAAGDRALCLVSASLLQHLRSQDLPGRHGGDEFVLLLRESHPRQAIGVAARIVDHVQRHAVAQQLPPLSLSFGVVQVAAGEALADALRRADQALYEAKRQGRSRAVAAAGDEARPVFSESQRLGLMG